MKDYQSRFNNHHNQQKSQQEEEVFSKYQKALEKEVLSGMAIIIAKMNEYTGHQKYEGKGRICHKTIDDVLYILKLKDVGTEEEAIKAGFTIEPLMVKDSSITMPEGEEVKWELHLSCKNLKITINGLQYDVEADEDSESKTGTLNMVVVVKAENNCRVDSTIVTSAVAA